VCVCVCVCVCVTYLIHTWHDSILFDMTKWLSHTPKNNHTYATYILATLVVVLQHDPADLNVSLSHIHTHTHTKHIQNTVLLQNETYKQRAQRSNLSTHTGLFGGKIGLFVGDIRLFWEVQPIAFGKEPYYRRQRALLSRQRAIYVYKDWIFPRGITAYRIWSDISSISHLNRESSSLGLFCHVPLKRDQGDWDWRLRWNVTPNAIGCNTSREDQIFLHIQGSLAG